MNDLRDDLRVAELIVDHLLADTAGKLDLDVQALNKLRRDWIRLVAFALAIIVEERDS